MREGPGHGPGGIAQRRFVEGIPDGDFDPIDEGRQVIRIGPVNGLETRQLDQLERIAEARSELCLDTGEPGGHQSAAAGQCFDQYQWQAFVKRRQHAHGAIPGEIGELGLGELTVLHHRRRQPVHPGAQRVRLVSRAASSYVEPDGRAAGQNSFEGVEQPGHSLGGTVLADVQQCRIPLGITTTAVKEIFSKSGADDMDAGRVYTEPFLKLLRVTGVEDDVGVVTRATRTDVVCEVGAELHLAEAGGVAVGDDRGLGREVLEQGRHQPHMVGVDEVGLEIVENRLQVSGPGAAVGIDLLVAELREPGARIRHDVAHPGNREVERRRPERQRMDTLGREPPDLRCGIVSGHADDGALRVSGHPGMSDKCIEGDAAAGQRRSLGEEMEDAHGKIMNYEFGIRKPPTAAIAIQVSPEGGTMKSSLATVLHRARSA